MKIAVLKKTNEQVQIVSTNGGWTSIRTQDGAERKVRNGELTEPVMLTGEVAKLAEQKAAKVAKTPKAPKAPKARREPMPLSERKNGKVDALYLQFYQKVKAQRGDRVVRTMDNGDLVAQKMRDLTLQQVYTHAAKVLSTSERALRERFEHLNLGMQRMNLGNMVRRAMKGA